MTHLVLRHVHSSTYCRARKELLKFAGQCIQTLTFLLVPVQYLNTFDSTSDVASAQSYDTPALAVLFEVRQQHAGVLATQLKDLLAFFLWGQHVKGIPNAHTLSTVREGRSEEPQEEFKD